MAELPGGHVAALAVIDRLLRAARQEWWVIAGTAVALHSWLPMAVDDIDVLIAAQDVPLIAEMPGVVRQEGGGSERFRSDFLARYAAQDVMIEFMSGFELYRGGMWRPVRPESRMFVPVGGVSIPIPDRRETIAMLAAFGRPKDLARVALLNG